MEPIETTMEDLKKMMVKRPADSHKGTFGRVLLICGSPGMTGAAVLCAKATLRSGAGLVTAALPVELFPILQTAVPEAMCVDRALIHEGGKATDPAIDINKYDAVAIGCGMGDNRKTFEIIEYVLTEYKGPVVIDADGINSICRFGKEKGEDFFSRHIAGRAAPTVMTPHPGEAGRILEYMDLGGYRDRTREERAKLIAEKTGATVILKGHETLTAPAPLEEGEGKLYINRTGNPGMATGGSGDVLTGVIAALLGGGVAFAKDGKETNETDKPADIARAGVYIHGRAGDLAAEKRGETGMTAMDIVDNLPEAFKEIIGQ